MLNLLANRILQALGVMLAVSFIAFALTQFVGDPVNGLVGQEASLEERAAIRDELGLNDPVPEQFARFLAGAVRGDFGYSYKFKRPVAELVGERLPATLELVFASALLALVLGVPLGIFTALARTTALAQAVLTSSLIGVSLPTFVVGILLIYVFAVTLGWLPPLGRGETVSLGFWTTGLLTPSGRASLILPAITLGLYQLTLVLRLVRTEMLEVMRTDYIRFARARGIRSGSLYFRHALKNTAVPVITIVGLQIGGLIAFSIVTESVFQWPGLGLLFIGAVQSADVPIMSAYLVLVSALFVIISFLVDMAYILIDPRIRVGARGGESS